MAEPTAGNARWLAPEIIKPRPSKTKPVVETKAADVFAFAMLAYEIFAGELPFEGQAKSKAACRIHKGDRPEFPQNASDVGLTAQMWAFLQQCWHADPEERPGIDVVVTTWEDLLRKTECVRRTPNDQNRGELVPDEDQLPSKPRFSGGRLVRPSKRFLSSRDITNSPTSCATTFSSSKSKKTLRVASPIGPVLRLVVFAAGGARTGVDIPSYVLWKPPEQTPNDTNLTPRTLPFCISLDLTTCCNATPRSAKQDTKTRNVAWDGLREGRRSNFPEFQSLNYVCPSLFT